MDVAPHRSTSRLCRLNIVIALSLLVAAAPDGWGRSDLRSVAAESTSDGHAAFPHPDECTVAPLTAAEIQVHYEDEAGRASIDTLPGFDRFTEQDGTIEIDGVPWVMDGVVVADVETYPPGEQPSATDRDGIAEALRLSTACSNAGDELRLQRTYPTAALPFFYKPDQPDDEEDGITPADLVLIPLTIAVPLPPSIWKPAPVIRDLRMLQEDAALAIVTTVDPEAFADSEAVVELAYFVREADRWRGVFGASQRFPDPDTDARKREQAALGSSDALLSPITNPRSPAIRWKARLPVDTRMLEAYSPDSIGARLTVASDGLVFGSWVVQPYDRPVRDHTAHLVAVDATSGEEQWRVTGTGVGGALTAADGVVLVLGMDGGLHAYDAVSGTLRWDAQRDGNVNRPNDVPQIFGDCVLWPASGDERRFAAASLDGLLYLAITNFSLSTTCIDLHTGTVRWTQASVNQTLTVLNLTDGSLEWTEDLPTTAARVQLLATRHGLTLLSGPFPSFDPGGGPAAAPDLTTKGATTVRGIDPVGRRSYEGIAVPTDFQLLGASGGTYVGRSGSSLVGLQVGRETTTAWEVLDIAWAVADGGVVYVGTTPGCITQGVGRSCAVPRSDLVALNIDDGTVRWRYPLVGELAGARFTLDDGVLHGWGWVERTGAVTYLFALDLSIAATVVTPDMTATLVVDGLFVCPAQAASSDGATPTAAAVARVKRATCRPAVDADAVLLVIRGEDELEELRIAQDGLAVIAGLPAGPYELRRLFESTHTLVDAACIGGDVSDPVVVVVDEVAVLRLFPGQTTTCQAYVIEVAPPADSSEASSS